MRLLLIVLALFSQVAMAHDCAPKKPSCVKAQPKKVTKKAAPVVSTPVQKQEQHQVVNVYNQGSVSGNPGYYYNDMYDNRISFLLGYGPKYCCRSGIVLGVGYDHQITQTLWRGVEVFTNYSYFGKIGIGF